MRETCCDQCGATASLTATDYGELCFTCLYRQNERDDANDNFEHLSASTFGFRWEDE